MPSLSHKNEAKKRKHDLKRAGLAPKKDITPKVMHPQKINEIKTGEKNKST